MIENNLVLTNYYLFECYRKGVKIWEERIKNIIVTVGLNDILDKYFKGVTYSAAWYVGLVDNAGWTAFVAGDTLVTHTGWTEFTTYSGSRKTLTLGTVSGGSVDNSANKAAFTITTGGTLKGAFICTVTSGTSGILYGEGSFTATRTVALDDVLNVTITLTSASG